MDALVFLVGTKNRFQSKISFDILYKDKYASDITTTT